MATTPGVDVGESWERFKPILKLTLIAEGRFSNHAKDPGGKTMYGWTETTAREEGFTDPIETLTVPVAQAMYYRRYWIGPNLPLINSDAITCKAFDIGVNQGRRWGGYVLQLAARTVISNEVKPEMPGVAAADVAGLEEFDRLPLVSAVDGRIGPQTVGVANVLTQRYERSLFYGMALWQGIRYLGVSIEQCRELLTMFEIADWRDDFIRGWLPRTNNGAEFLK